MPNGAIPMHALPPTNAFVTVQVEEHEALPDGCSQRFRATAAPAAVHHVSYEPEEGGPEEAWAIRGEEVDGTTAPALARLVDDSSAGTSVLVTGGAHGLRLTSSTGKVLAVPYLLLAPTALID